MHASDRLSIGAVAKRTGMAVSALRYYEANGLISSARNAGGQRRFLRSEIRRVSFILIAQRLGFPLQGIRDLLDGLPDRRTPTLEDWSSLSLTLQARLDEQIATLQQMRNSIEGCIGCGCLSLDRCALYNAGDHVAGKGSGPRLALNPED